MRGWWADRGHALVVVNRPGRVRVEAVHEVLRAVRAAGITHVRVKDGRR